MIKVISFYDGRSCPSSQVLEKALAEKMSELGLSPDSLISVAHSQWAFQEGAGSFTACAYLKV